MRCAIKIKPWRILREKNKERGSRRSGTILKRRTKQTTLQKTGRQCQTNARPRELIASKSSGRNGNASLSGVQMVSVARERDDKWVWKISAKSC